MNILFIAIGVCVLGYVVYGWIDHFRSGRYKNISTETPISPRLKDGRKPTLTDVNMDLSEKILNHDFDSNDNT
ncbi:MAG: hypothetical protein KBF99_20485 [Leptospiraceae bacterium]|nr:hypothetical protein [Leptospiraceae bacterium]MBK7054179.1 hypothetical protein [Leptospiraceae bacterium]MBK9499695.1 hypothetical protein [Leptospiraceae bacterium]MBP9165574.1 hypothetical protein [Leptospiraceae bacterium]